MRPLITHVISSLSTGGAERSLLALIEDSRHEFDHRVVVLSTHDSMRGQFEAAARGGVTTVGLTRGVRGVPGFARAIRQVLHQPSDILHGWMHHGCLIATGAVLLQIHSRPCRLVWGVRNDDGSRLVGLTERLAIGLGRRLSHRCDVMISNSQRALDSLTRSGFVPKRAIVVPNGVAVPATDQVAAWRAATRSRLGIAHDTPVAIYVGNLRPAKDPACLLQAIQTAVRHMPTLVVLLVGRTSTGSSESKVCRAIRAQSNVRVLGEVHDVMPLISASDALVLSSRSEGCPTVVLEALACSRPVVSTDVGDLRQIVGAPGAVVDVGNGVELGLALVKAVSERHFGFWAERNDSGFGMHSPYDRRYSSAALMAQYRQLIIDIN